MRTKQQLLTDGQTAAVKCPICGCTHVRDMAVFPNIPAFGNVLYDDREQAAAAVLGTQSLALCETCGFVFNRTFEPEKMNYSGSYHAERGGSDYHSSHMKQVLDLIETAEPFRGKRVLEIGCGTGEFLRQAAAREVSACLGVDPTADDACSGNVRFMSMYLNHDTLDRIPWQADILIHRNLIEHIQNPADILSAAYQILKPGGLMYLETPRLNWILRNGVFYDFPYEHCSYFTDDFILRLLEMTGFTVVAIEASYEGQYFSICARKDTPKPLRPVAPYWLSQTEQSFLALKETYLGVRQTWSGKLDAESARKKGFLLWGASAKGVMCGNLLRELPIIGNIDINVFKQGKFIPGTAAPVFAPAAAPFAQAQAVLVMNDVYLDEVRRNMQSLSPQTPTVSFNSLFEIGSERVGLLGPLQ